MQNSIPMRRNPKPSEEGFLLLAVMFLLALLVLSLAVAAPAVARSIQRDREVETMQRGKQYTRAIQLYYRRFHAYPPNLDALVKTNEIRFLRKRYIDPMTGKDDWKPILFGQNKAPTAMGFFGQPLSTGGSIAGIGPTGGNGLNGGSGANGPNGIGGLFNSIGGGASGSSPGSGGSFFSSPSFTDSSANTSAAAANPSNGTSGAATTGATGSSSTDASGNSTSSTGGTGTGSNGQTGQTGQTFGGAGIIGFSPASAKPSILIYKKKDHYNEWEFTYDPIMEMKTIGGGNTGTIGQPAGSLPGAVGIPGITTQGSSSGSSSDTTNGQGTGSTPPPVSAPTPPETSAPQQ
jgi:type II secretory pathway pseudopilin PulG